MQCSRSFHLWPKLFGVQPFKVCKCKLVGTVSSVAGLSFVHEIELLVTLLCFDLQKVNIVVVYCRMFVSTYVYAI